MFDCRRRRRLASLLAIPMIGVLLAACGGGAGGGGDATGDEIPGIGDDLISAAQAEGGVVLYGGGHTQDGLELLQERMQERFGIQVTFTRDDSGSVANAISSELASGRLNADVVSQTDQAAMQAWADDGVIRAVDVANADRIVDGLHDPAAPQLPYMQIPLGIMYNSARTDPAGIPGTWTELAAEDRGRIVTSDPSASGTALTFYALLDRLHGPEWMAGLADRGPIVSDSSLALPQLVLTGEATLGVPAIESAVLSAAATGEPLAVAYPSDGVPVIASEVAALTDAPRPNAAELTVRYHLSEEFQQAMAETGGRSVLDGLPAPPGAEDFGDRPLLTAQVAAIAEVRDDLRARFDGLYRR
ncbi:extracellular solute-binding protein [Pseudonocardia nematodicida]|uniref:Extracellular solute-binding protein n=1 Tax=Pseudonocardia nematodicida TaxID=1206997 RepID=A0ABV1KIH6_9PSEU